MLALILMVHADPLDDALAPMVTPAQRQQFADASVEQLQRILEAARKAQAQADGKEKACLTGPVDYLGRLPELAVKSRQALGSYLALGDDVHASSEMRRLAVTLGKGQEAALQVRMCMNDGNGLATLESSSNNPNYAGLQNVSFLEREELLTRWQLGECGSCY